MSADERERMRLEAAVRVKIKRAMRVALREAGLIP
jgi:hypothetical protein